MQPTSSHRCFNGLIHLFSLFFVAVAFGACPVPTDPTNLADGDADVPGSGRFVGWKWTGGAKLGEVVLFEGWSEDTSSPDIAYINNETQVRVSGRYVHDVVAKRHQAATPEISYSGLVACKRYTLGIRNISACADPWRVLRFTVRGCCFPVTISGQPSGASTTVGASIKLSVVAAGTAPISYHWFKDGVSIASATAPTLALDGLVESQSGSYVCRVSNCAGSLDSAPAVLIVRYPPPINDNFANRILLAGFTATSRSDNLGASVEPGEPSHFGGATGRSIWWSWKAPATGGAVISTEGSDFEDVLAIYTGSNYPLSFVRRVSGGAATTTGSRLVIPVERDVVYQIAVDGYSGARGHTVLNISMLATAPNDAFANAERISGNSFYTRTQNFGATSDPGEHLTDCFKADRSLWWDWTAPSTGPFTAYVDTENIWLGAFKGNSASKLSLLALSTGSGFEGQRIQFNAHAGDHYLIAAGGVNGDQKEFSLYLESANETVPDNDFFQNRTALIGTHAQGASTTRNASYEVEPAHSSSDQSGGSVWWAWTAPVNGTAIIDSSASLIDHQLAVYTGSASCSLHEVASARVDVLPLENNNPINALFFDVIGGAEYQIRMTAVCCDEGEVGFTLDSFPHPQNDARASAVDLAGDWARVQGSTLAASHETSDPQPFAADHANKTVWWRWTAPPTASSSTRPVMISTAGSSFDTLLAVYGDYPGSPDVHINDDVTTSPCAGANQPTALSSAVIFVPQEGKTYWIMLDGSLRTKNLFLPGRDKLVRQYSGDYVLTVDYSTLNIVSTCADVGTCSDVSNSAKVSGQIHLSNYGQAMTGPLSLQLYAINGNSRTMGSSFPDTKTVPLQSILVPRAISPGESLDISYANVCFPGPGPDVSPGGGSSVGWSVYAVLLEFLGGAWQPVDSSLLVYGKWPVVQPFGGPNGGVIRSDPPSPVPKGLRQITLVAPTLMCEDRSDRVSAKAVFADLSELPVEPEWSVEGPIRLDASVSAANPTASALQLSSDADAKISAKLRFAGKIFSATSQLRVLNQCGSVREIKRIKDDIRMEIATADSRQLTIMQTTSLTPPIHWAAVKNLPVYDRGVWRVTNSLPDIRGKVFYQVHWNP